MKANSLKNEFFLCEYHVVLYYKIFVTLFIYYLFEMFIVLATWYGTLVLYITCLFLLNYCSLILRVVKFGGCNIYFVNNMCFPVVQYTLFLCSLLFMINYLYLFAEFSLQADSFVEIDPTVVW